mmetsp:Transcript_9456/g.23641  ORF Transcript_9456/g.23641 Transcript_9456/m.23641 type:complete len:117 (-) Transcript_9456:143-493(-)
MSACSRNRGRAGSAPTRHPLSTARLHAHPLAVVWSSEVGCWNPLRTAGGRADGREVCCPVVAAPTRERHTARMMRREEECVAIAPPTLGCAHTRTQRPRAYTHPHTPAPHTRECEP